MAVTVMLLTLAAAYVLLPVAGWALVRSLTYALNACIWLASSSPDNDAWTLAVTIGKAAAGALATPTASAVTAGLVVVGAIAVFGLQRLLGSEEDSSR
jgi:hypothetical protein